MATLGRLRSCSRLLQIQFLPHAAHEVAPGAGRLVQQQHQHQQLQHLRGFAAGATQGSCAQSSRHTVPHVATIQRQPQATSPHPTHMKLVHYTGHGHGVTYKGLTLHPPARWHVMWGTGMCALMWFWIMYRAYYDGEAFVYGHGVHFEHDDHHDDKEGHH